MNLYEKGYRMLVCDFDFSLSKTDRSVSERTVEAIKEFQRNGGVFAVCTGRALPSLDMIFDKYGFEGYKIAYHGSIITDSEGNVIADNAMKWSDAVRVLDVLNSDNNSFFIAYIGDKLYCNKQSELMDFYYSVTKCTMDVHTDLINEIRCNKYDVRKILIIEEEEKVNTLMAERYNELPQNLQVCVSQPNFIEAVDQSCIKGNAVRLLAEKLGIPLSEVVAVGDSSIDDSMLEAAGVGIAVSNAMDCTKLAADYVCEYSCDEDAVYHIVKECAFGKANKK